MDNITFDLFTVQINRLLRSYFKVKIMLINNNFGIINIVQLGYIHIGCNKENLPNNVYVTRLCNPINRGPLNNTILNGLIYKCYPNYSHTSIWEHNDLVTIKFQTRNAFFFPFSDLSCSQIKTFRSK